MWLLKLRGGVEMTESDLGCWDNVPANVDIEALAIAIQRENARPYVMEYKGYERYCCARVSHAGQGLNGIPIGYSVTAIKDGQVFEHDILPDGMRFKSYPEEKCQVPERCFRRGVSIT